MVNPQKLSFLNRLAGYVFFISHSREDGAELARMISVCASKRGLNPFIDTQGIVHGEQIPERVKQGLRRSKVLMVLLTNEGYRSSWVAKEINDFGSARPVLPIIVKEPPGDASPETIGVVNSLGEKCIGFEIEKIAIAATDAIAMRRGWFTNRRKAKGWAFAIATVVCMVVWVLISMIQKHVKSDFAGGRLKNLGGELNVEKKHSLLVVQRDGPSDPESWVDFENQLAHIPPLESLVLTQQTMTSIEFLHKHPSIKKLNLFGCESIESFDAISSLVKLERIELSESSISDSAVSNVAWPSSLKQVRIVAKQLSKEALAKLVNDCNNLELLDTDFSLLSDLTLEKLQQLHLDASFRLLLIRCTPEEERGADMNKWRRRFDYEIELFVVSPAVGEPF